MGKGIKRNYGENNGRSHRNEVYTPPIDAKNNKFRLIVVNI